MTTVYRSIVLLEDFHEETRLFFKGRRVAVSGGTGFIGSHLVEQLITLGAQPVVLTRQEAPPFLSHIRAQVVIRLCDLNDYAQTHQAVSGCSAFLSLAASVAGLEYNSLHPASIFQDNLQTFFNSIRAAKEHNLDRFLVTSSACVYPRHCSIPTPESEGFKEEPEPTNSGYGWSKRMEEYLGVQYAREYGLPVAIGRPYNAYGPRDNFDPVKSSVIPALIQKAFATNDGTLPVWGDGSHSRSFLYVDDFARGLLEVAARYPLADALNIGAFEEVTIGDVASSIAKRVGDIRGCKIRPVFDKAGMTGQPRRKCDTTKAREKLDYSARISFEEGLRKTIEWYASEVSL